MLSRCFHNNSLKQIVESTMRLLKGSDINETHELCKKFFTMIHDENCGQKFLNVMLDCPD